MLCSGSDTLYLPKILCIESSDCALLTYVLININSWDTVVRQKTLAFLYSLRVIEEEVLNTVFSSDHGR